MIATTHRPSQTNCAISQMVRFTTQDRIGRLLLRTVSRKEQPTIVARSRLRSLRGSERKRLVTPVIIAIGAFMSQIVEIHIRLLDEGTKCSRPTQALDLGHGLLKVLPTSNYDPKDEVWEFPPDSIVRTEVRRSDGREFILAV